MSELIQRLSLYHGADYHIKPFDMAECLARAKAQNRRLRLQSTIANTAKMETLRKENQQLKTELAVCQSAKRGLPGTGRKRKAADEDVRLIHR